MNVGLRRWILVILILLAFGRGVWALGGKSLWWDESLSLHRATGTLTSVLSNEIILTDSISTVVTTDNHPLLYFLLLWAAVRLAGQSEFALRFLSLASVILLVPLLYVTGRRLVDEWAGLAAAALGALSPMYLWYGQEARMYAMLAFLGLLSFYCFVRAFYYTAEPLNGRRQWWWIGAYIVTSAGVIFVHYLGMLLIAFELLALAWIIFRQNGNRRTNVLALAIVILIMLPLLVHAWSVLPLGVGQPGFRFVPLPILLRDLLNSFSLGLSVDVDDWYVLLIDSVFLLFLVLGLASLVRPGAPRKRRGAGLLLAGYLLIPIVLVYLQSFIQPVYMNSRHLIYIAPPFQMLVAVGLTRWRGRTLGIALVGGLLMVVGIGCSTWNYFNEPAYDKDHHREWGDYLREHVRPGDVVVVDPPHIAELYQYYADSGTPWVGLPLFGGSRQQTEAKLEDLRNRYDRIWLALSHTPPWGDPHLLPQAWLDENAFRVGYQQFHSYASNVQVASYLPAYPSVPRLPDDAHPIEVRYSPSLRLAGYRFASSAQPGKLLHVNLFWAIDEPIPEQASVALRLVDDQGHLWGHWEQCPHNGLYPMWQWQPGLLLGDEHELPIWPGTPPGTYQVELVLASRPDGCAGGSGPPIQPLVAPPQARRGDRVFLGTVDVLRAETSPSLDELGIGRRHRTRFDGLALLGSNVAPVELEAGGRLHVSLYWEAYRNPPPDARFRLLLVDAAGEIRQEVVIRPVGDAYSTDHWLAGDRFQGQFWLSLPGDAPTGSYKVELVPEPPLKRTGIWATLRQWIGSGDAGVRAGQALVLASVRVLDRTREFDMPAMSSPLEATIGRQANLAGYDLDLSQAHPGGQLQLTLYWQAGGPMVRPFKVFTHLLDAEDRILAQHDAPPGGGCCPANTWAEGEVIVDEHPLALSADLPAGTHRLVAGMYDEETQTRLPVFDAAGNQLAHDRIQIGEIVIEATEVDDQDEGVTKPWHDSDYTVFLPLLSKGHPPE